MLWANHFVPKQKNTLNKDIVGNELLVQKNPAEISGLTEEMNPNPNPQSKWSLQEGSVRERAGESRSSTVPPVLQPPELGNRTGNENSHMLRNQGGKSCCHNDLSDLDRRTVNCPVPLGVMGDQATEAEEDNPSFGYEETEHETDHVDESATVTSVPLFEEDIQQESRNSAPESRNSAPVQTFGTETGQNTSTAPNVVNVTRETMITEKQSNVPKSKNNAPTGTLEGGPEQRTKNAASQVQPTSATTNRIVTKVTASATHTGGVSSENGVEEDTVNVDENLVLKTQDERVLEEVGQSNVSTQSRYCFTTICDLHLSFCLS